MTLERPQENAAKGQKWRYASLGKSAAECGLCALAAVVILLVLFSSAFLLGLATDDLSLIGSYSADERGAVQLLLRNVENHDLDPRGFYAYGYLHPALAYGLLSAFERMGYDIESTRVVAFSTRGVAWLAYACLLLVFERSLRPFRLGPATRLWLVALLGASVVFYRWSHVAHPDVLQAMLAFCALWVLLPGVTLPRVMLASAIAGLSFGAKASGLFALGIPLAACAYERLLVRRQGGWLRPLLTLLGVIAAALLCFVVGWIGSNPYVPENFDEFVKDTQKTRRDLDYGPGFKAPWRPLVWLTRIDGQFKGDGGDLLLVGLGLLLFFLLLQVYRTGKAQTRERSGAPSEAFALDPRLIAPLVAATLYVLVTLGQLMLQVNKQTDRYLLHVIPFICWQSAAGFGLALRRWRKLPALVLPLLLVYPTITTAEVSMKSRPARLRVYKNAFVQAGMWMVGRYPESTRVLAERYSYVPRDHFKTVYEVAGIVQSTIERREPDVLVLNYKQSARYSWKKPGTRFQDLELARGKHDGAERFLAFHRQLFGPDSAWKVVYENSKVVILEPKRDEPSKRSDCEPDEPDEPDE